MVFLCLLNLSRLQKNEEKEVNKTWKILQQMEIFAFIPTHCAYQARLPDFYQDFLLLVNLFLMDGQAIWM